MRGKAPFRFIVVACGGITPAYAGKSSFFVNFRWVRMDHPRLCGEKATFSSRITRLPGSPPPMRGKADQVSVKNPEVGITPAYAGKSYRDFQLHFFCWDHPRLCGEKTSTVHH